MITPKEAEILAREAPIAALMALVDATLKHEACTSTLGAPVDIVRPGEQRRPEYTEEVVAEVVRRIEAAGWIVERVGDGIFPNGLRLDIFPPDSDPEPSSNFDTN
jgi:hypothetical protein